MVNRLFFLEEVIGFGYVWICPYCNHKVIFKADLSCKAITYLEPLFRHVYENHPEVIKTTVKAVDDVEKEMQALPYKVNSYLKDFIREWKEMCNKVRGSYG